MPVGIDQKVEIWKNKLLDLGKRNRLINYRETKRSTLSIKTPPIFDLFGICSANRRTKNQTIPNCSHLPKAILPPMARCNTAGVSCCPEFQTIESGKYDS